VPASDVSELLATVLNPRQLGALRHATAPPAASAQKPPYPPRDTKHFATPTAVTSSSATG
jgi:hypothetical protein